MGHKEHKSDEKANKPLNIFVITLSDTRGEDNDESGKFIREELTKASHNVAGYKIIKDDRDVLENLIVEVCKENAVTYIDAVVLNGGTGISLKDITYETLKYLYDKEIFGFGELFRNLSYQEIGTSAMMSRASAGIYNGKIIFSIPGSLSAVRLALDKIILKEIGHIYFETIKHI